MNKKMLLVIPILAIGLALFFATQLPGATIKKMEKDSMNKAHESAKRQASPQARKSSIPVGSDSAFYVYYQQVNTLKTEVEALRQKVKDDEERIRKLEYKVQYLFNQLQEVKKQLPGMAPEETPAETPSEEHGKNEISNNE